MNNILRTVLAAVTLSLCLGGGALAQSFNVKTASGNVLRLTVRDPVKKRVQLVNPGSSRTGTVEVPEKVIYKKQVYKVTSIGEGAFGPDDTVEQLILPASLDSIWPRAFKGCRTLCGVVFPVNEVFIGEEAFMGTGLKSVSFGSGWKKVDLKEFRWVSTLREIFIPAQVRQITGLKTLECLENITVDGNNRSFKTVDGILYDYEGKTLLSVPRNRSADVEVPEGVDTILNNAFLHCNAVENITLPSSLTSLSFLEFENCMTLQTLTMKRKEPILTASIGGREVFVLKIPRSFKVLKVSRTALKEYRDAIVKEPGMYRTIDGKLEGPITGATALSAANLRFYL